MDEQNPGSEQKHTDTERLAVCEQVLQALENGADSNEYSHSLAEELGIPIPDAGYIVGTIDAALRQATTGTTAPAGETARFALTQLAAATDPEEVADALIQRFGLNSHAADECCRVTAMALGQMVEEEFTILDLSPKIRILAGGGSFIFFAAITAYTLSVAEPGASVLVAGGALIGSLGLLAHGLAGWWSAD